MPRRITVDENGLVVAVEYVPEGVGSTPPKKTGVKKRRRPAKLRVAPEHEA